ncbi:MAG: sensor histidine kinase [Cytophagaceae bacterium]
MRLTEKKTLYYLIFTFLVLSIASVFLLIFFQRIMLKSLDESLVREGEHYQALIEEGTLQKQLRIPGKLEIFSSDTPTVPVKEFFTIQGDEHSSENRLLKMSFEHKNTMYRLHIQRNLKEVGYLQNAILPLFAVFFLIILAGMLLINKMVSDKLWKPFYRLINKLEEYDLNKTKIIEHDKTDIDEFDKLSRSVEKMTKKIYMDFVRQKEFNENLSHEFQTPLSIIRNKLELLIQSGNLKESEMSAIGVIFDSVRKLSQLNKGLILLSELDYHHYKSDDEVNLCSIIKSNADNLSELIEAKSLGLKISLPKECMIKGNAILLEILIINLLTNAIRHNVEEGEIEIILTAKGITIINTGKALNLEPEELFERFKKDNIADGTIGLGLAIVKKICDYFCYTIDYSTKNNQHKIEVIFPVH